VEAIAKALGVSRKTVPGTWLLPVDPPWFHSDHPYGPRPGTVSALLGRNRPSGERPRVDGDPI
jgi:hypothetical protein